METKRIFLYNNNEAKEKAKEKAKTTIDAMGIFFVQWPS